MSDSGGTDNPAFSNDEYTAASTNVENSQTETLQQEQKDTSLHMSNGHSFVSQHYVEPTQDTPEAQYKTETRIEVPTESDKTSNTVKTNGIHGNGNNNDLSFLNSSITSGQINDGKKEQIEAVNLELVSMRPYTGNNLQTKGQEACEIPSDPYEEYFVPVNEHRKYIRGEKLYVTKDKRSKSSYWRRIACWGFGLSVLAVALIIAILAATGVILTQEATQPLDNEHQRSLDDINAAGSQEFIKNPPSSPSPETSTFPPWRTTDETMLKRVPNALEGSIWLDNLIWNDDLMDIKTRVYRDVASEIENNLSNMIGTEGTRTMIKIYNITKNGQVLFRIGNPPVHQPDVLQDKIEKMLRQNGNMVGKYHLSRMDVKHLIDECQYENLNCSELCKFDYTRGIFACACLPGKVFDAMGVNCIDESDFSDVDMVAEKPKSAIQDVIQGRGRAPEQSFEPERDHDHWMNHHYHYDNVGSFTDSSIDKKDETSLKTMLTMNEEPKYEPEPASEPNDEPKSESEVASGPMTEPKLKPELASDINTESKSEPKSELETPSESIAEPKSESELTLDLSIEQNPYPEPAFEPNAEEESEPELPMVSNVDPKSDQESKLEPTVEPKSESEPSSELTAKSDPTSKPDVELTSEQEPVEPTPDAEPNFDLEPTSIPMAEPKSEPEPSIESIAESESAAEDNTESKLEPIEPEQISVTPSEPKSDLESNVSTQELELHSQSNFKINSSFPFDVEMTMKSNTEAENNFESTPMSDIAGLTTIVPNELNPTLESTMEFNLESNIEKESTLKTDMAAQFDTTTEMNEKVMPVSDSVTENELMMEMGLNTTNISIEEHIEPESTSLSLVEPELPLNVNLTSDLPLESTTFSEIEPETMEKSKSLTKMEFEVSKGLESNPNISQSFFESPTIDKMNATEIDSKHPVHPLPVIPLTVKPDSEKQQNVLTNVTKILTTMIPETVNVTVHSDSITNNSVNIDKSTNQTNPQDSNFLNSIDSIQSSGTLNKSEINSTQPWMNKNTNIPSQLLPEKIDPYVLIRNAFQTSSSTESIDSITDSLTHELISLPENVNEKSIEIPTIIEEKHPENMSPFLPIIIREKDSSKKAPRLDKDEQDFPNPFEPHVEDVIIHHQITMTPPADVNGTEFTDVANKPHLSHDVYQTETSHQENIGMTETTIITTPLLLTTQIDLATTMFPNVDEEKNETRPIDSVITDTTDKHIENMGVEINNNVNMNNSKHNESLEGVTNNTTSNESTTYMDEQIYDETTTSRLPMSIESVSPAIIDSNNENSKSQNKFEDNTVEDQYNDIIEERISKKIDGNSDLRKKNFLANKLDLKSTTLKNIETTPVVEENESTTVAQDNLNVEIITTTEMTTEMTTEKSKDDSKFTTEIPIMPVEIQQDISTTEVIEKTESSIMNNSASMIVDSPKTIYLMSMLEAKTTAQIPILPEEFSTTEMSTIGKMSTSNESELPTTQAVETSTVSFDNIKPVSETIIDDPEPVTFDHTHFFRTTESMPAEEDEFDNISEEKLKIIPLDFDAATTIDDTSINTTDTPSTMQTIFILNDMPTKSKEDIPPVPKLKITEITSASQQPQIENHHNETINTTIPIKSPSTKEIIPVYETIEDDVENPMVKPLNPIKNIFQLPNITMNQQKNEQNSTQSILKSMMTTPKMILNDNQPMFSKCNVGQFQCINGTSRDGAYCVSLSSKCDSENDCSDASDEINCEIEGCPGNFQCKSGQCLGRHLVCNGIADCDDGSDEHNCQDWTCHFDEFKCPSGRCIPDLWRCNGRPDCEDHRDEYSCSKSCSNDEYLCPSENWCVPQTWRCNGIVECINGEDEKLCDCGLEQFKCETGGCTALHQVCDGIIHCPDHSDEWDCLITNITSTKDENKDETETHIPVGQPVLLKIKHYDGDRHLICSDNWTRHHSDIYCRSLGYFGSETVETVKYEKNGKQILRLKENYQDTISLVGNLELADRCESNEFVKISCQEFSCGSSENEGPTARLIGGTPAGDGQWSSVALLKEVKSGVVCTASVLGPFHALASYSCIHEHRHSSSWEMLTGRELLKSGKVKSIIPYPQVKYNQFLYNDDIALIQLETPLILSRNLSAICLPSQQFQPRALCVTAGWGFPTSGEVNLKLKFLPVPIYNTEECNATSHYAGFITKSNICAGFTGTDKGTCYNDEGAPLICASETGRWELQGLLSHHSRCSRDHPAIYSSLSPVISWLQHSVPALQMRI